MPISSSNTVVDIEPEDGFFDWYMTPVGMVGDDGRSAYRSAVEFALMVPPGAQVHAATLTFSITNSGGPRQVEVNAFPGWGGLGFGGVLLTGQPERKTVDASSTATFVLDLTGLVSSLVNTGGAFVVFNVREVPANSRGDRPMMVLLKGGAQPELRVDYATAAPLEGHYSYRLGANSGPFLWDFGGILLDTQNAKGGLTDYHASGNVRGDARGVTIRYSVRAENERSSYVLSVDPARQTLTGTNTHRTVTVTCQTIIGPCQRHATVELIPVTIPLSAGDDGSWVLDLALRQGPHGLSGNAFVTFPNGDVFQFAASGRYVARTQTWTLVLKGVYSGAGAGLVLTLSTPTMSIQSMRGTVVGQKVNWQW